MMRSMFAGVSGLKVHQIRMDVIGNNIANVNSAGFKSSRVTFRDMLGQSMRVATAPSKERGGTNPQQIGLGVTLGSVDVKHTQGNTQSTGYLTDLAIEGDGFFVLGDGLNRLYTRAGMFGLDNGTEGNLVSLLNGTRVQGYKADKNGLIDINSTPLGDLHISVTDTISPLATTLVRFAGNLDNRYTIDSDPVSRTIQVFDSLGTEHTIIVGLKQLGDNEWRWNADWLLISDELSAHNSSFDNNISYTVAGGGSNWEIFDDNSNVMANSSDGRIWTDANDPTIQFKFETALNSGDRLLASGSDGKLTLTTERTMVSNSQDLRIEFNKDGSYSGLNIDDSNMISFTPFDAEKVDLTLDFSQFTQYADIFTGKFMNQNGYKNGALESYAIDQNGRIVGSFSNGLTRNLGQIALATFVNPAGLERAGSTMFVDTPNSGTAQINVAGHPGYGTISPNSLEMSNVDLGEEFTEMIITQRGFQANSRIITSSDELLQELVNLKR